MNDTFSLLQKYTGISKYSKSEVITPQWVVSDMVDLLPQEVFNPNATFFDPAVKSGRFLIEIYNRLMASGLMKQAFPNEQDRHKHIIEKQLFGFATSPTAATVVRKTLYDNPLSTGNIRFTSDKLTKERVQGVFNNMKFDVVIGNPPYNKGMDLDFVNKGFEMSKQYTVMITPAKWQTADASHRVVSEIGYEEFRDSYQKHMCHVVFYPCCKDVFDIYQPDGITFFLIDKAIHESCIVENRCNNIPVFNSTVDRTLENRRSLLNIGNEIIEHLGNYKQFMFPELTGKRGYEVWTNTQPSGYDWYVTVRPRYVLCPSRIIRKCEGGWCEVEAAQPVFEADTIEECESFLSWINCKFTRFFLVPNISRLTGILTDDCFRFVPAPPTGKFDHIYTDDELYKDFNLPQKYIDVIEAVVKERK